mgnify:CR=1 FL=1
MKLFIKIMQLLAYWPFRLAFILFFSFEIKGITNLQKAEKPFILASNHISYLDPIFVGYAMPFKWRYYFPLYYMMDDLIYKIVFFVRFLGAIPARKGQGLDVSIAPFLNKLESECIVVMFPEGGIKKKRNYDQKGEYLIWPLKAEKVLFL